MQVDLALKNLSFKDINTVICGWHECENGHSYGPAVREHYLLHYVVSGKGTFDRGGKKYNIKEGQIFLIRPFEMTFYQADIKEPWTYQWIGFSGEKCEELLEKTRFKDKCVLDAFECSVIFENMVSKVNEENKEIYIIGKLYELLYILAKDLPIQRAVSSDYVQRAIDFLDAKYVSDISVLKIAEALNIDRRYLSRIFSQKVGVSPQRYLVNIRMKKAMKLISERGLNVAEAARSVGYTDQYNFSKIFKKTFGVTPSFYKK